MKSSMLTADSTGMRLNNICFRTPGTNLKIPGCLERIDQESYIILQL